MRRGPMRVVMVHNMIAPYRVPLFNALARDPRIDLRFLFMARTESNRSWRVPEGLDFQHEFMRGLHLSWRSGAATLHVNPGVVPAIHRHDPDAVVLCGYDTVTVHLAAMACAVGRRRQRVYWAESNPVGKPRHEGLRAIPKRWLIRRADCALVPGRMAEEYVRRFASPNLRVEIFPNVVDESLFRLDPQRRAALRRIARQQLGLENMATVLFSGQMIERKGFHDLLMAFEGARFDRPVAMLAVGQGILRPEAERLAGRLGPPKRMVVLPFQQTEELPRFYAAADLLILPSHEDPWPLVVVEAMMARVPTLLSDAVGNSVDLVREGENGWVFPAGDVGALQCALETAVRSDFVALGAKAQSVVASYCALDRCVESFARAVGAA